MLEGVTVSDRRRLTAGADYVLASAGLLRAMFGGDVIRGLVFLAALRLAASGDGERRPVSLSAVARTLGMPIETTRRHVLKLQQDGFVTRTPNGGVRVADDLLHRRDVRAALAENGDNLAAAIAGLKTDLQPQERALR